MSKIVIVNAEEFGIEESKAAQIRAQFQPMLDKMVELEQEFNQIQAMEMSPEKVKAARELRLKYVKVRTGTAAIHKEQKAFYLAAGRYIDGWKLTQLFASQGIESQLEEIEGYYARIEAAKIEALRMERWNQLSPYMDVEPQGLGVMAAEVFAPLLAGAKAAHEAKVEAERKAEAERIERERIQELHNKRAWELRPYIEFLTEIELSSSYGEMTQTQFSELLDRAKNQKAAKDEKIEAHLKEIERLKAEREAQEKASAKDRADAQAKIDAERKAREEAEAKIRAAEAAKEKARKEAEAEALKLAKAPVKKQMAAWVNSFTIHNLDTSKLDDEQRRVAQSIASKYHSFKVWALTQIENL